MTIKAVVPFMSVVFMAACGSSPPPAAEPPPAPPPAAPAPAPTAAAAPKVDDNPNRSNINISDEIKKACGITDAEAHFAFDSAMIRDQDRVVLKKLADCFATGPLKGRGMRLVGHADPRGDDEYNRVLGQRRADNVKSAINSQGLESSRMQTTSRGEDDATGSDETGWAKDRRVDIVLGS